MIRPKQLLVAGTVAGALVMGTVTAAAEPVDETNPDGGPPASAAAPVFDADDVTPHLEAFQQMADDNGGHRAAGSAGYAASADYVVDVLSEAGFEVTRQTCTSCQYGDDNIIADWPGGDEGSTVMLGAHLDGVTSGAGLNDNGSGSAALLAVAQAVADEDPGLTRHLRFAWWAEEELGMHGSAHYVSESGVSDLSGYVNLDMVGGVNAGYFVDNISGALARPFVASLDESGYSPQEMTDCCSDDQPFAQAGVATTLLSTGYGELKTEQQAAEWGGEAGEPFDPCYHTACDTYPENVDVSALLRMTNAAAYGLWETADNPGDPNPYNPVEVCGESYSVIDEASIAAGDASFGTVYLLWSNANADNCSVALKSVAVGSESQMDLVLEAEDGRSESDSGAFGYYAGPVNLAAGGTCVEVTASITHDGETAEGTIPMGHCG